MTWPQLQENLVKVTDINVADFIANIFNILQLWIKVAVGPLDPLLIQELQQRWNWFHV